jgi:hypothetical protein
VPLAGRSVGLVMHANVQSRSEAVTAVVMPLSSTSALRNPSLAISGTSLPHKVGGSRGSGTLGVAKPMNRRTPVSLMAATIVGVPSVTGMPRAWRLQTYSLAELDRDGEAEESPSGTLLVVEPAEGEHT